AAHQPAQHAAKAALAAAHEHAEHLPDQAAERQTSEHRANQAADRAAHAAAAHADPGTREGASTTPPPTGAATAPIPGASRCRAFLDRSTAAFGRRAFRCKLLPRRTDSRD